MSLLQSFKESILSPKELFKYRQKRDNTIPSKGGQKEFEPDGTWLQQKRLESFLHERTALLSEPRVEKLKNVVEGAWDDDKQLVNLKKPGKFWMHMGFTDERRNWLYPEEALYLMETNTLELYYRDRPMSIQEAYVKMLGHGICLEEYQVFAHLRRVGYVVVRHEEERIFTDYEKQINLDQYVDVKKRKELLKKGKGKSKKKISRNNGDDVSSKDTESTKKLSSVTKAIDETATTDPVLNGNGDTTNGVDTSASNHSTSKRLHPENDDFDDNDANTNEKQKLGLSNNVASDSENHHLESDSSSQMSSSGNEDSLFYHIVSWSSCFSSKPAHKDSNNSNSSSNDNEEDGVGETEKSSSLTQTSLDQVTEDFLPNISNCITTSSVSIKPPSPQLLPVDVAFSESDITFTMEQVKAAYNTKHLTTSHVESGMNNKVFSCLENSEKVSKIKAANWCEYKRKRAQQKAGMGDADLVEHLWKDSVTPLMRPSEITSYKDVLDRLNIIQSADTDGLSLDDSFESGLPKVSFDVHLPDHRFKKTMPGAPNHRVCVSRCDGVPPGLSAIQHYSDKYKDGVALHWAVVDSGEIAFYVFDNTRGVDSLDENN